MKLRLPGSGNPGAPIGFGYGWAAAGNDSWPGYARDLFRWVAI